MSKGRNKKTNRSKGLGVGAFLSSINPDINAPATPEKILMSINKLKKKYEK